MPGTQPKPAPDLNHTCLPPLSSKLPLHAERRATDSIISLQARLAQLSRTLSSSISRQPVSSQNLLHGQIGLCLQTAQLVCHSVSGICLGKSLRRVPPP